MSDIDMVIDGLMAGLSKTSVRAYEGDLKDFAATIGASTGREAAARLLECKTHLEGNSMVTTYRANLIGRGLAPATINRRLSPLRTLVDHAMRTGVIGWGLLVSNVAQVATKDCRGPGRAGFDAVLAAASEHRLPNHAARDVAMLRLLHDLGLRRSELLDLDIEHVDLDKGTVTVSCKGRIDRDRLKLPAVTLAAVRSWIDYRGNEPGPLFGNFDRGGRAGRLTGSALYSIVKKHGDTAGVDVRPHGLRHTAITSALENTNGDIRKTQKFARLRDVNSVLVYDDCREDVAGQVAELVSGAGK